MAGRCITRGTAPRQHSDALVQSQGCKIPRVVSKRCLLRYLVNLRLNTIRVVCPFWRGKRRPASCHAGALPVPGHGAGEPIGILTRVERRSLLVAS